MKRKWIDLFLFYSTLIIIISGIVLYIMPHGRVAYFTGWTFLGLGKDEWDNLHVVFGILMVIVAIWHIILNWKPLKKYLFQKESLIALVIVGFIMFGTIKNIQPFKAISDFEEYIKSLWEENKVEVPIPHAELLTLKQFCNKLNIPLNEAKEKLKKAGIKFEENQTLKEIALKNHTTPAKIYEIIKPQKIKLMPGSGIGRMTLKEFCQKYDCNISIAINKLNKNGIKAKENETLKEIGMKNNKTPMEIAGVVLGD